MTIDQARALARTLSAAADAAEAAGRPDIDLGTELQAMDDASQAELDAAIARAAAKQD